MRGLRRYADNAGVFYIHFIKTLISNIYEILFNGKNHKSYYEKNYYLLNRENNN